MTSKTRDLQLAWSLAASAARRGEVKLVTKAGNASTSAAQSQAYAAPGQSCREEPPPPASQSSAKCNTSQHGTSQHNARKSPHRNASRRQRPKIRHDTQCATPNTQHANTSHNPLHDTVRISHLTTDDSNHNSMQCNAARHNTRPTQHNTTQQTQHATR